MIDDTAGRTDDDVRAAPQTRQLHAVALPAVDRQHVQTRNVRGVLTERLGDLDRELTSRREHQGARLLLRGVEMHQDRDRECRGLAGAGLGEADDVRAGEQRRNGRGLNRRGRLVAHVGDGREYPVIDAEVGEGRAGVVPVVVGRNAVDLICVH